MAAAFFHALLPIKIGFWNPGSSKGGVVFGMGWSCGALHRISLGVQVASGRFFVLCVLYCHWRNIFAVFPGLGAMDYGGLQCW
jgi:hypothetical protein